jgi:predicted transcriptional regulator
MHRKNKLCMGLLILFLIIIIFPAYADKTIVVTLPPGGIPPGSIVNNTGADTTSSFWQLPLWIQITYIISIIVVALGAFKLIPIFIGKVKQLVDNRNRTRIYSYIRNNPGSTVREISKNEDINLGSVKYHITQLELAKWIVTTRIGKFVRHFQNSRTYSDKEKIVLSAIKNDTCKHILIYIRDNPGVRTKQIADQFDIKESTAHWYMEWLIDDKIIMFILEGKRKTYYLEEDVKPIIETYIR